MEISTLTIKIDKDKKQKAKKLFSSIGMDMDTAVNALIDQALYQGGIPENLIRDVDEVEFMVEEVKKKKVPVKERLKRRKVDVKTLFSSFSETRRNFFKTLSDKGIKSKNISFICEAAAELLKTDRSEESIYIYTSLLSENGLLFGKNKSNREKIDIWLNYTENYEFLSKLIKSEISNYEKVNDIISSMKQSKQNCSDIDSEEHKKLFKAVRAYSGISRGDERPFLRDNLAELIRMVNINEKLRSVKPYIYFAVISRKNEKLTNNNAYIPNIANVFKRIEYKIEKDNGKNFYEYQKNVKLFVKMKELFADDIDVDLGLSDYCFLRSSNLGDWFYDRYELDEHVPKSPENIMYERAEFISLCDKERAFELYYENDELAYAYQKLLLDDSLWKDFVIAFKTDSDITEYIQRLYNLANAEKFCKDKEKALELAKIYLMNYMEMFNRDLLIDAFDDFIMPFKT